MANQSFLGMKPVIDTDEVCYCVGARTAVAVRAPAPEYPGAVFEQKRAGLHHLGFRARADMDELHGFLCSLGVTVIRAARGSMGAGILFAAVRRPRRNKVRVLPRSGKAGSELSS